MVLPASPLRWDLRVSFANNTRGEKVFGSKQAEATVEAAKQQEQTEKARRRPRRSPDRGRRQHKACADRGASHPPSLQFDIWAIIIKVFQIRAISAYKAAARDEVCKPPEWRKGTFYGNFQEEERSARRSEGSAAAPSIGSGWTWPLVCCGACSSGRSEPNG